jgi:hypothetical protein
MSCIWVDTALFAFTRDGKRTTQLDFFDLYRRGNTACSGYDTTNISFGGDNWNVVSWRVAAWFWKCLNCCYEKKETEWIFFNINSKKYHLINILF